MKIAARREAILQALMLQQRRHQLDIQIISLMLPIHDHMDVAIDRIIESGTTSTTGLIKLQDEIRTWPDSEGKRRAAYRVRKLLATPPFNQEKNQ